MEIWHYVAIGAVVVIGGVWYVRRRNKKQAQAASAKSLAGAAAYQRLKAAGVKTEADRLDLKEEIEKGGTIKLGMGEGGAVALSRSLY